MFSIKDRKTLTFNQKKQMFHEDQTINPETGRKIEINKDTYNKLVILYQYPTQIQSPKKSKNNQSIQSPKKSSNDFNNPYNLIPKDVLPQIFNQIPLLTARLVNKQTLKENEPRLRKKDYVLLSEKGKTPKLAKGDIVLYDYIDGKFLAVVDTVTASTKAYIIALTDYNDLFNTITKVNTYRKYMTIVKLSPAYFDSLPTISKMRIAVLLLNKK